MIWKRSAEFPSASKPCFKISAALRLWHFVLAVRSLWNVYVQ